jgi:hypothetical protein
MCVFLLAVWLLSCHNTFEDTSTLVTRKIGFPTAAPLGNFLTWTTVAHGDPPPLPTYKTIVSLIDLSSPNWPLITLLIHLRYVTRNLYLYTPFVFS